MSLDGFVAGPEPTLEEPLGRNGERLHDWIVKLASWRKQHGMTGGEAGPDDAVAQEAATDIGAVIMGRRMFSGGEGSWDEDPNSDGWWGETPPFHAPVFILTHHARPAEDKQGGTSFIFVTDGIESAMVQARQAAGDKNILVAGGAQTIQQAIKAGLVDELDLHIVPILLGGGTALFEGLEGVGLEKTRVIDSPMVTHVSFKLKKQED